MDQNRLDIFTRRLGPEEQEHAARIRELENRIKTERQELADKKAELLRRERKQQAEGPAPSEIRITDQVIDRICKPNRLHIKKLEKELIELKGLTGKVQKAGSQQSDLFNS